MRLPTPLRRPQPVTSTQSDTATLEKQLELVAPKPAWRWITLAAVLITTAIAVTLWWLLQDPATVPRWEAVRTALLAGGGMGAALTLMLAFRRQRQQELQSAVTAELTRRSLEASTHDATERRVTELQTKAGDQLGHANAAVRLGGLYALERLAQGNPEHRQTIVSVICAYLRMPYLPELVDPAQARAEALRDARRRHQALRAAVRGRVIVTASPAPSTGGSVVKDTEGERQVRLTAQRILAEHLRDDRAPEDRDTVPVGPRFWEGIHLDLTGAILTDLDFHNCHVAEAQFDGVIFTGNAKFYEATFTGDVSFKGSAFRGKAEFYGTAFAGDVNFNGCTFTGEAEFDRATFGGEALFRGTAFTRNAKFDSAIFKEDVTFSGTTFTRNVMFEKATFTKDARFDEVTFTRDAVFIGAFFSGYGGFNRVIFSREAWFDEVIFTGTITARTFAFNEVQLLEPDGMHCWPKGWTVIRQPDGSGTLQWDDTEPPTPETEG
ncbi:pentapeptide repeat-containing protein [Streptosporangium sandarakinum]|uniref:pentapeptide repeat-containing protein n=1 Tax=Streptosporangium sandarakinum TaxID=1260955 RepID=UPI0033A97449